LTVPILVVYLLIVVIGIGMYVLRDLLVIKYLRDCRERARELLQDGLSSPDLLPELAAVFGKLKSQTWAQRTLLDQVILQISADPDLDETARLEFLLKLGELFRPSRFRDIIYQRCDELEANLRRGLGRPVDADFPTE
jgi:hypothetical protein